ncbi:hypothetical protein QQF64_014595 [Cirrhinus molitorella]|uniref:Uncharacterized protein n=1 Tax=Cirrhinus molitorella TaxID=172907 RepID=A0ABR3NSY2_9TELE
MELKSQASDSLKRVLHQSHYVWRRMLYLPPPPLSDTNRLSWKKSFTGLTKLWRRADVVQLEASQRLLFSKPVLERGSCLLFLRHDCFLY